MSDGGWSDASGRVMPASAAGKAVMASTHLYQIFYSDQTRAQLDPGFIPLDNFSNARPDWREYWPMRNFLLNNTLVDGDYYGFFSPKFKDKTRLAAGQVREFILEPGDDADVVIFSPMWDMSGLFWNIFEQAESCDPGIGRAMGLFFRAIRPGFSFDSCVTDSRNTIFSNYFAAKPAFWRAWLEVCERLFVLAEGANGEIGGQLNLPSNYDGNVQRKVFVMERVATFLLATETRWKTRASNPFRFSGSPSVGSRFHLEAVLSDALKVAYAEHPLPEYRDAFIFVRGKIKEIVDAEMKTARGKSS